MDAEQRKKIMDALERVSSILDATGGLMRKVDGADTVPGMVIISLGQVIGMAEEMLCDAMEALADKEKAL